MARARRAVRGRPKTDPSDPQLPVNPHRVRAALLFSGLSQRDVVSKAREQKLAPLTVKSLHNLGTGNQRTSRRSRLEAIAEVTGVSVPYLTEQADEDLLDALALGFAVAEWDTYTVPHESPRRMFDEIRGVTADARVLLDLSAWRRRTSRGSREMSQREREQERDDFAVKILDVLRTAFGRRRRRDALASLRKWLEGEG